LTSSARGSTWTSFCRSSSPARNGRSERRRAGAPVGAPALRGVQLVAALYS